MIADDYRGALSYIRAKSTNPPKQRFKTGHRSNKEKLAVARKQRSFERRSEWKAEVIKTKRRNAPIKLSLKRKLPLYFIGETNTKSTRMDNTAEPAIGVASNVSKPLESVNEIESHSMYDNSSADLQSSVITVGKPATINSTDNRAFSQSSNESETPVNVFVSHADNLNEDNLLNRIESVIEQRLSESNAENGVFTVPTLSIQSNQQIRRPFNKKPIPALKRCTPHTKVDKRNKPSKNNKKPQSQVNTKKPTPGHRFTTLANQSNRSSKYLHEESSQNYRGHSYFDPRVQRSRDPITIQSNTMIQSACYQSNVMNTSDMQNTQILTNQGQPLKQPIQNPYSPFYADYNDARMQGNSYYGTQGMLVQSSTEMTSNDQREQHPQSHAKNTERRNTQTVVSEPLQARESSHNSALSIASAPTLYRSSNERDIFTEVNIIDSRAGPQRYGHDISNVQNMMNLQYLQCLTNQSAYLSEHLQKMQQVAVNRNCSHQDPRNNTGRSTGINHLDQRACPEDFKKKTPPTSQMSTFADISYQLPAHSNNQPHSTARNDLEQNVYTHTAVARPAGMRGLDDGVTYQNFKSASYNTQDLTTTTNHTCQAPECSSGKSFAPVLKDYLLDPSLKAIKRTKTNNVDSRVSVPVNVKTAPRTIPCTSNSTNQLAQSMEHCNITLIQPAQRNTFLSAPPMQENFRQHKEVNDIHQQTYLPQGTQQNISSAPQKSYASCSSNLTNQFGQSLEHCNITLIQPAKGNSSLQAPHMQDNPSRPMEMNDFHQKSYPQIIQQNISPAVQNSSGFASNSDYSGQCSCNFRAIPEHSHQNLLVQESQIDRVTAENPFEQKGHLGRRTEKLNSTIKNFTNIAKESTNHSVRKPTSNTAVQELAEETSLKQNDENYSGQSGHAENMTANKPTAKESPTAEEAETFLGSFADAEEAIARQITDLFSRMNLSVLKSIEEIDCDREALLGYSAMLTKLTTLMESYKSKSDGDTASSPKDATVKPQKATNKKQKKNEKTEHYDADDDDDGNYDEGDDVEGNDDKSADEGDDDNDSDEHVASIKMSQKRSLVLPPEYNPKNTRWTLKYPKASSELTELMPRSRVYVDSIKLANCKLMSKDHKTFARMLLSEIFTRNALSVCSWTGAKANAFTQETRPGLDPNARNVLLNYVNEYGIESGWGKYDKQTVLNSVRSKIQEIRGKTTRTRQSSYTYRW